MKTVVCKDTGEVCHTYSEYLQSRHWKNLKIRYWKSKMPKCCGVCGSSTSSKNMHHKTYKRIGHEWLMDIIPLCQSCHHQAHIDLKNNTNTRKNLWNIHKVTRKNYK